MTNRSSQLSLENFSGNIVSNDESKKMKRTLTKLMRKTIQYLLKNPKVKDITINATQIKEWLGNTKFKSDELLAELNQFLGGPLYRFCGKWQPAPPRKQSSYRKNGQGGRYQ